MEWTASVPVAATPHVSAPKPPNNPTNDSNNEDEDVPMREANEGTKKKEQPAAHNSKKQSKGKDKSVHWGQNVVHEVGNGTNKNKHNKGLQETQQEMVWKRKVTTGEVTAATTKALAAKTPGVTEAPKTMKQEATSSKKKTTARQTTATTATVLATKEAASNKAPKQEKQEVKQQLPVQPKESKQKTQSGTGSRTHDRENRTNVTPNKERRNVNR